MLSIIQGNPKMRTQQIIDTQFKLEIMGGNVVETSGVSIPIYHSAPVGQLDFRPRHI